MLLNNLKRLGLLFKFNVGLLFKFNRDGTEQFKMFGLAF
jgi:hypothetical protein